MTAATGNRPCEEVLRQMYFFIDNELDDATLEQIRQHIADCGPCLREVDLERLVKGMLARSCSERAPLELRQRVVFSLRQLQADFRPDDSGAMPHRFGGAD